MVPLNGYLPSGRQNRRRERPGSRARRTITRKANLQQEYAEGYLDARDTNVSLPSDRARPSPLLRENFHQTWQRWKEKEAEEWALVEMNRLEREKEQQRLSEQQILYGGNIEDDELRKLGVLYDDIPGSFEQGNTVVCEVPLEQESPLFILRSRKPKRVPRRRSTWQPSLELYLSLSSLGDDPKIACLLSSSVSISNTQSLEHLAPVYKPHTLSLETTPSLPSPPTSLSSSLKPFSLSPTKIATPPPTEWEFINLDTSTTSSPSSNPETWILLSDDS